MLGRLIVPANTRRYHNYTPKEAPSIRDVWVAREAARRIQCANNLKQIGGTMVAFVTSNDEFPWALTQTDGNAVYDNQPRRYYDNNRPNDTRYYTE